MTYDIPETIREAAAGALDSGEEAVTVVDRFVEQALGHLGAYEKQDLQRQKRILMRDRQARDLVRHWLMNVGTPK